MIIQYDFSIDLFKLTITRINYNFGKYLFHYLSSPIGIDTWSRLLYFIFILLYFVSLDSI